MELGLGYWSAKALLSAVGLGLFGELAQRGPLDAQQLRARLGIHPRGATDFFDALVPLRLLERDDRRYSNVPDAELFLDPAKPSYIGGVIEEGERAPTSCGGGLQVFAQGDVGTRGGVGRGVIPRSDRL